MSNRSDIQKDIEKLLGKSFLNQSQIKKMVTFQVNIINQISLKVDLHGLNLEETKDLMRILFDSNKLDIVDIEFIHGYNRGTVLKDYIDKDFVHVRLDQGRHRLYNEGTTTLYLKQRNEVVKAENKSKINLQQHKSKSNTQVDACEGDITNNALFRLTMIKEKVKAVTISESINQEALKHILDIEETETIKPLLGISLTKEEFLLRILNLYIYKDTLYVEVSFNKLNLIQVSMLLDKLLSLQSENQIIITLRHKNKKDVMIKEYLHDILKDNKCFESRANVDSTSTMIIFLKSKRTQDPNTPATH